MTEFTFDLEKLDQMRARATLAVEFLRDFRGDRGDAFKSEEDARHALALYRETLRRAAPALIADCKRYREALENISGGPLLVRDCQWIARQALNPSKNDDDGAKSITDQDLGVIPGAGDWEDPR